MRPILFLLSIFFSCTLCGQRERYVSFELGGSGGIASLNYEKTFVNREVCKFSWRLGFSVAPIDRTNGTVLIFPLMVHGIVGKSNHKLDLGIGQSLSITTRGQPFVLMPAVVGYRFQPEDKRCYWRIAYTPLISYLLNFQVQHWAGLTFGYKLNAK